MQQLWADKIPYIKTMKEFYSKIEYEGLNLWPIMANEVYTYYRNQEQRTKKERLLTLLRCLFLKDNLKVNYSEKNKILATYFMPRKDHKELVKMAIEKFSPKEMFFLNQYEQKKKKLLQKYKLNIFNLFLFFKIFRMFKKNKLKNLLGKHYWLFIAKTYLRFNQIKQFYDIYNKLNPKAYISFCSSAFAEEAILTLIANNYHIPTFTLQHGFLDNNSKQFSPFMIQMENLISDYMLLWGKSSYDLQKKYYPSERLLIVGNPKYLENPLKKSKTLEKTFTFFASVPPHIKSNQKVIEILNSFAKENSQIIIKIKIHPFDSFEHYKTFVDAHNVFFVGLNDSIPDLLSNSDLIIVHNTSIAYEGLLYNVPILRYSDENFADLWDNNDTFSNIEEFYELIKKLKKTDYLKEQLNFYKSEKNKHFYFEKNKSPSEVYYNKINQVIKRKSC